MKTKLFTVITCVLFCFSAVVAQTNQSKKILKADFNYSKSVYETSAKTKTISFKVTGIENEAALKKFIDNGKFYDKFFTVSVSDVNYENQTLICDIATKTEDAISVLKRFFVANNITDIKVNADKAYTTDTFFSNLK